MRRIHVVLASLGLFVGGTLGVCQAGCGSDDPAAIVTPPDGSASSTSSSSSSGDPGTSTSSSSSSSSGTIPPDGGSTTSSGGASNPFKITCGAVECDAGGGGGGNNGGVCCVRDGGTNPVCLGAGQANQCDNSVGENTLQLNCDETADCPKGNVGGNDVQLKCCLSRQNDIQAQCQPQCTGAGGGPTRPQLCKKDTDCSDGGANQPTCAEKTCRGFKLRVCGAPQGCNN